MLRDSSILGILDHFRHFRHFVWLRLSALDMSYEMDGGHPIYIQRLIRDLMGCLAFAMTSGFLQ